MHGLPWRRMRRQASAAHARLRTRRRCRALRRAPQGYSPWTSRLSAPCVLYRTAPAALLLLTVIVDDFTRVGLAILVQVAAYIDGEGDAFLV